MSLLVFTRLPLFSSVLHLPRPCCIDLRNTGAVVAQPVTMIGRHLQFASSLITAVTMSQLCRYIGASANKATATQAGNVNTSSIEFRMTQALPKQLLQQAEQQARRPNAGEAQASVRHNASNVLS